jgi:hypothetical protein
MAFLFRIPSGLSSLSNTVGEGILQKMKQTISGNSAVVASTDQVSSNLVDEVVILNRKSGVYYGLNDVGVFLWNLIQEPKTVNEIRDAILEEYEVDFDRCERDLFALLQKLATKGLVEIRDDPVA